MDSPYVNQVEMEPSNQISILKETSDDSGYVTVTPSSAECTRMSVDASGNLSTRTPYFDLQYRQNISSSSLSTPEDSVFIRKKKLSFDSHDSSVEGSSGSFSANTSLDKCRENFLPTLHEGYTSMDIERPGKPKLKRQKSAIDETDWSYCESSNLNSLVSPKLEPDVNNKLQNLAFFEDSNRKPYFSVETPAQSKLYFERCANSDPRDYNSYLISRNNQLKFNKVDDKSLDLNTPYIQHAAQDAKYTCTPVKGPKKSRRSSSKECILGRSSRTPEKKSPPHSGECHSSEHVFVKKLNFETQVKLGSPEKNQLLYPTLKPVTPPKKSKLMKAVSPKCRKRLEMSGVARICYIGREHVDFLKNLGETNSYRPAVFKILNYLSGEDLVNVCKVSKCWSNICKSEPSAEERKSKTIRENEKVKENRMVEVMQTNSKGKEKLTRSMSLTNRDHLCEIQNQSNIMMQSTKTRSPPVSPGKRNILMYYKVGSEDSKCQLRKCPKCKRPARVREQWAVCNGRSCGFVFCPRCLVGGRSGSKCLACRENCLEAPSPSKVVQPRHGILSKKSRRNLRRL